MKTTQVTVTLDAALATKVSHLATVKGETFEYMIAKLVEHGEKDMAYRTKRNAAKWVETKNLKATVEELRKRLEEKGGE